MLSCVPEASGKHVLASEIKLEPAEIGSLNLEKPQLGCRVISVPGNMREHVENSRKGEEIWRRSNWLARRCKESLFCC